MGIGFRLVSGKTISSGFKIKGKEDEGSIESKLLDIFGWTSLEDLLWLCAGRTNDLNFCQGYFS